jgi:hypothetical protein
MMEAHMMNFDVVGALAFFTIGSVLVFAIVSWMRAKKAQDNHEDAAVAKRMREDDAAPDPEAQTEDFKAPNDSSRSWTKERGANPPTPMPPRN